MTVTALIQTTLDPENADALAAYLDVADRLMTAAGATLVARYEVTQTVAGTAMPQFFSVVDYPDAAAVAAVFEHPDYLALAPVIKAAFTHYDISLGTQV